MVCTGKGEIKCDSEVCVLDDEENDGGVASGRQQSGKRVGWREGV